MPTTRSGFQGSSAPPFASRGYSLSAVEVKALFEAPATVEVPVALSGAPGIDLTRCDLSTVRLAGVPFLRCVVQDVATPLAPFVGKTACNDCTTAGPDGRLDVLFLFDQQAVFRSLEASGALRNGDCVVVALTGKFLDRSAFRGEDVVKIFKQ